VTAAITFEVVPSVIVAVAVNRSVVPSGTLGVAGVTATENTVAAVTMSVAVAEMPLGSVTWTVLVPTPLEVASPWFGPVAKTAVPVVTLQESTDVRFCVDPSL
jgi:hypothetical protein